MSTDSINAAVECGPLGYPANGDILLHGTLLHSNATFFCDDGYILEGSELRVCLADGTWSGTTTSCKCELKFFQDQVFGLPISYGS